MFRIAWEQESLTEEQLRTLHEMWLRCMRRIIVCTTLAGSGHPGGSMSSLHLLLLLYGTMKHFPQNPCSRERDRLLVSMGHISPGVYGVLCEFGYMDEDELFLEYRRAGSPYAGHVECCVPGVEWNTGNLGQGLSAAMGMALASRFRGSPSRVGVLMGDGEQQKGQIAEARRFAVKYELDNLYGVVDRNHLQIGGATEEVMPQNVRAEYAAAGWNVLYLEDGHDFEKIFQALKRIHLMQVDDPKAPSVLVARTVMGKGVSFMENEARYHGMPLKEEQAAQALEELRLDNPLARYAERRGRHYRFQQAYCPAPQYPEVRVGEPKTYGADVETDNRSAYGAVLEDLARLNNDGTPKVLGFSCDLEDSVKMKAFHRLSPRAFFECGIQEHHAATVAGAASKEGFAAFLSTFGVFGVVEVYNQHRLNDINQTSLKLVCTHLGLDVGEDGQTHQCIDYIGLLQNLYGFSVFAPADPNQTDRIIRYVAARPGNHFVGMGRSKVSVVTDEEGRPFFGGDYRFRPGKADWVREGRHGAILTYGPLTAHAVSAHKELRDKYRLTLAVLNVASIKPLDVDSVLKAARTGFVLTVEDHHVDTGLGGCVARTLADAGVACKLVRLGVRKYGRSGRPADLYHMEGIDREGIVGTVVDAHSQGLLATGS